MSTHSGDPYALHRFVDAQYLVYDQVCWELKQGRKLTHWMWFIFPQIGGLSSSAMSKRFAISSLEEAAGYLDHPVIGPRLVQCTELVTKTSGRTLKQILLAVNEFNKAIRLVPSYTLAYNNRGYAYHKLGEDQRAIQDLDKAIQLDPNYAKAYNNRGYAYHKLGEDQRAIEELDKAIHLYPNYALAYNNRGYAYRKVGNYAKSDADKARACSLDRQHCD